MLRDWTSLRLARLGVPVHVRTDPAAAVSKQPRNTKQRDQGLQQHEARSPHRSDRPTKRIRAPLRNAGTRRSP